MALLLGCHDETEGFGLFWILPWLRHTEGIHLAVAKGTHRIVQSCGGYRVEVLRRLRRLEHSCRRRRSNMRWHIDLVHVIQGFGIVRRRVVYVHRNSHGRKSGAVQSGPVALLTGDHWISSWRLVHHVRIGCAVKVSIKHWSIT